MPRASRPDYSADKPWLATSRDHANTVDLTTTGEVRSGDYFGGDWYETLNEAGKYTQVINTIDMGDPDGNDTGVNVHIDVPNNLIALTGKLGTNQSAAATSPGSVTGKVEVFDADGVSLGFLPLYDAIT